MVRDAENDYRNHSEMQPASSPTASTPAALRGATPVEPPRDLGAAPRGSMPVVIALSVAAHVGLLALAAALPEPATPIVMDAPVEFIPITPAPVEPEVVEPEVVEPEPLPEPEVAAAVVPTPRPAPRRAEPTPAPVEEPAPPPEVMVAESAPTGAADEWTHPEGAPGGLPGGEPGGTGAEVGGPSGAVSETAPRREGISRAELRRRLRGYVRGTLSAYVNGRIDYPLAARREHLQGVVVLRIRLARDGRLLGVRLSRSSGHAMLDRAALASVERLNTMPPPPAGIPWGDERELPLPVTYLLQ